MKALCKACVSLGWLGECEILRALPRSSREPSATLKAQQEALAGPPWGPPPPCRELQAHPAETSKSVRSQSSSKKPALLALLTTLRNDGVTTTALGREALPFSLTLSPGAEQAPAE